MVTHSLGRVVTLALLLAACGGGGEEEAGVADLAAIRAQRDSVRKAAEADSIARAGFAACSDSVTAALAKAAKGKKPAAAVPEGMIPPEVLQTCGKPPAPAPAAVPAAAPAAGSPAAAPAQALTPQQQQVARADSVRQAREQARQDSIRGATQRAGEDAAARARLDSVRQDSIRMAGETQVMRESFTYTGGARDPFASLLAEDRSGPEFADLLLVGIYLDLRRSSNSVAVLRDKTTQKRYKLRVGDRLGRLQVAQIRQSDVVFTIEDIGFERQETLSLRKREAETP
ncbi:MAG: hypothetical protein OEV95_03930 [Gemmatimonadota bacterium]|nr:hypothetical protein [Gemmatimonadota bacterium]MDH5282528.1 hypothetical protein [Gemmatimonadota bacterium]